MTVAWYQERGGEEKLRLLIRHLVLSFPLASILSRQVEDRYHVFVIVPHDGSREKTLQVETTLLREWSLRVEEFAALLSTLDLRTVFDRGDRCDLDWFGRHNDARQTSAFTVSLPGHRHVPAALMR
jgi:hypothetical protein